MTKTNNHWLPSPMAGCAFAKVAHSWSRRTNKKLFLWRSRPPPPACAPARALLMKVFLFLANGEARRV